MGEPKASATNATAPAASIRPALVLAGCTLAVTVNVITIFNGTLTAFMGPIAADTGWSRGAISLGLSLCILTLLLLGPPVGRLADRIGPWRVVAAGAPLLGLSVAAIGWIPPIYPLFLAICAIIGATGALTFTTLYLLVASRWFDRRLGLALGITACGTGIGFMLGPIVTQALIAELGWRLAYVALGAISTVIALFAIVLLIRDRSVEASPSGKVRRTPTGWRSRLFWRLAFIYFLTGIAVNGTIVHLMPVLTDRGLPSVQAASLAAIMGGGVMLARLGAGLLLDHVDTGLFGASCFVLGSAGMGMLIAGPPGALTVAVLMVGIAVGSEGDVLAYITRRLFGGESYGANVGLMNSCFLTGTLLGPPLNGFLYDFRGSYMLGMGTFSMVMLLAASLHAGVTLGRPRRAEQAEAAQSIS